MEKLLTKEKVCKQSLKVRTDSRMYCIDHKLTKTEDGRTGYCSIPAIMIYITLE